MKTTKIPKKLWIVCAFVFVIGGAGVILAVLGALMGLFDLSMVGILGTMTSLFLYIEMEALANAMNEHLGQAE